MSYTGIRWFPPAPSYYFTSRLYRHTRPETVIVAGTGGEQRKLLKYGYFVLRFGDQDHKLNVYKAARMNGKRYPDLDRQLSVWFTDETTGKETYEVGRYVNVSDEVSDPAHEYTIDLNKAYNPYCAYSELYSCAIPRREDHLSFPVRAGELKYHP